METWYYSFQAARVDGKRNRIERVGGTTKVERKLGFPVSDYQRYCEHFEASEMRVSDYLDYWLENYAKVNCKYNTIKITK